MTTTIKVSEETRDRLLNLDISEKGKTFDMIINDLITYYKKINDDYKNNIKDWKKSMSDYNNDLKDYEKNKVIYKKLLKWANSKGFNY